MLASTNSGAAPSSDLTRKLFPRAAGLWAELGVVLALTIALSASAVAWFLSRGYTLYYGDAEAHLNIARRIIDSRTPGVDQIGTTWLPLPHIAMLPFVWIDAWWRSGLAGAIPAACAFVVGCGLLYAAVRRVFGVPSAAAAVAVFALNPNVLYLQSIPMGESFFFACAMGLLFTTVWFRESSSWVAVLGAAAFSNAASLTRYEGWILIPFVTAFFLITGGKRRWQIAFVFGALASLAPLAWFAHNWWYYRNALEFYNGPWSAKAIQGNKPYPGNHDLATAIQYFCAAVRLNAGLPLVWLGSLGVAVAAWKRRWWPMVLFALPPVFYVWSMYGSGTPIFVPHLWPKSYYNTRYGTAILPLLAVGAAALVALAPARRRWIAAAVMVGAAASPWLMHPRPENWVCWKESQVNSESRRAWTAAVAKFLAGRYRPGDGVFTSFGDLTGIFRVAGIPLADTLHEGNNPHWMACEARPALFLREGWAVGFSGQAVATAVQRANRNRPLYELVGQVIVPGADVVEIYRREGGDGALARLCAAGLIAGCGAAPDKSAPENSKKTEETDEDSVHEGARR